MSTAPIQVHLTAEFIYDTCTSTADEAWTESNQFRPGFHLIIYREIMSISRGADSSNELKTLEQLRITPSDRL